MKIKKQLIVFVVALIAATSYQVVYAQSDALSLSAYLGGSTTMWQRKIDQTEQGSFNRAMAQYGYLNATMAGRDEAAFDKYYEPTLDLLDELIGADVEVANCKAIKSSVYGLAMAYASWKGMYLGPKSSGLIEEAYEEEPNNPMVIKMYASSKLYTPAMFGGDQKEALAEFERCVELYEGAGDTTNNWIYMDALAHLGITYGKLGQHQKAIEVYTKALSLEPDFNWVKYSLKPSAEKLIASK